MQEGWEHWLTVYSLLSFPQRNWCVGAARRRWLSKAIWQYTHHEVRASHLNKHSYCSVSIFWCFSFPYGPKASNIIPRFVSVWPLSSAHDGFCIWSLCESFGSLASLATFRSCVCLQICSRGKYHAPPSPTQDHPSITWEFFPRI